MDVEANLAELGHLIGGRIIRTQTTFAVVNPATGEVVARCPEAGPEQLDQAVAAAAAAQPSWYAAGEKRRQDLIRSMAAALREHVNELSAVGCLEKGVAPELIAPELLAAGLYADHAASTSIPVDVLHDTVDRTVRVVRKPVGVVAAISPWNAPLLISANKVFAALLVGNTLVVKPSPFSPLGTLKLGELWKDIVPPGVVNILAGGDDLGAAMVNHPGTRLVSFTGSVGAGKKIAEAAGRQMKRVIIEAGGNDAAIVLPDVDVASVATQIFWSAFVLSGQACAAIKRLYVHESIYQQMVDQLTTIAAQTKAAPAADGGILGPLVTKPQYERVASLVRDALERGATAVAGGDPTGGDGYYYAPTILTNVGAGVRVVDEEQFGPVLPVIPFRDVDDAIAQANATEYGLGGSIWTKDIELGQQLAARLECGTAWVNQHATVSPEIPFGGVKSSGIGHTGGLPGIDGYADLQVQIIHKLGAQAG